MERKGKGEGRDSKIKIRNTSIITIKFDLICKHSTSIKKSVIIKLKKHNNKIKYLNQCAIFVVNAFFFTILEKSGVQLLTHNLQ